MKKYLFHVSVIIMIIWAFLFSPSMILSVAADVGYLQKVVLSKMTGKERITLTVSAQPSVSVETQADGSLYIKLEDMFVPENLRRTFEASKLNNISAVTPKQQSLAGKQWVYLTVNWKEIVPYAVKQNGKNIYIDFNVAALSGKKESFSKDKTVPGGETAKTDEEATPKEETPVKTEPGKKYTDRLISLDFQDASLKSVLRLMAEYGNTSIVSGEDVKGNVTLTMRNVPWEQALDTILDISGLAKKQMGDVISVMTLEKKKKDEADKAKSEEDQRKAEEMRKAREQKLMIEKGKLRQILIEAKIVEATESFLRNLGVTWGFTSRQTSGNYGMRYTGGTQTLPTNAQTFAYPYQIPYSTKSGDPLYTAAVNFPTALTMPTIGFVIGGAAGFLETQLAALETTTSGKIISAPKVVTMDNVKATIKQGDEVPYVTPASGTSPATITFKEALLKLEVKPKITDEGKISMEIKATNDTPDYATGQTLQGNPPIRKNEVESTVVIQDGDTVVIGGILKSQEDKTVSGLPWLQKIPILGWLFKTDNDSRQKRQLIIFITPKILQDSSLTESGEKKVN